MVFVKKQDARNKKPGYTISQEAAVYANGDETVCTGL
jgi:hypothetical protein